MNIPEATGILLRRIIGSDDYLVAYQIAFDILDNENQAFTRKVSECL